MIDGHDLEAENSKLHASPGPQNLISVGRRQPCFEFLLTLLLTTSRSLLRIELEPSIATLSQILSPLQSNHGLRRPAPPEDSMARRPGHYV